MDRNVALPDNPFHSTFKTILIECPIKLLVVNLWVWILLRTCKLSGKFIEE